ncbi:unnamed protein product [Leptidea sinapis]|uniref:Uncharacterized protein n=1 Tax=Leptidea sinapis TaxID=189913 RepID=A0A5E4QX56_9NEOP|nr:unnamed protein product [Leptidea sinapis]
MKSLIFFSLALQAKILNVQRRVDSTPTPTSVTFTTNAAKNPNKELCDIPSNVDCGDRKELQEPKPTKGCPRL